MNYPVKFKTLKVVEELNSKARQLENNLDYISNSSSDNPLLTDVTSKLDQLKFEIKKYKEQLVNLRKKKEMTAKDLSFEEQIPEGLGKDEMKET